MVPGALTSVRPVRAARPERGVTKPTQPTGRAMATPVPTSSRSPGSSRTSVVQRRSTPASAGCAVAGTGRSGSRRVSGTSSGATREPSPAAGSGGADGAGRGASTGPGTTGDATLTHRGSASFEPGSCDVRPCRVRRAVVGAAVVVPAGGRDRRADRGRDPHGLPRRPLLDRLRGAHPAGRRGAVLAQPDAGAGARRGAAGGRP